MAKNREIICKFYEYEGKCSKDRKAIFHKYCQTCDKYEKLKGGFPARLDLRRKKKEDLARKEFKNF